MSDEELMKNTINCDIRPCCGHVFNVTVGFRDSEDGLETAYKYIQMLRDIFRDRCRKCMDKEKQNDPTVN